MRGGNSQKWWQKGIEWTTNIQPRIPAPSLSTGGSARTLLLTNAAWGISGPESSGGILMQHSCLLPSAPECGEILQVVMCMFLWKGFQQDKIDTLQTKRKLSRIKRNLYSFNILKQSVLKQMKKFSREIEEKGYWGSLWTESRSRKKPFF